MAVKKLSKKQIDSDVLRLLLLGEAMKKIKKEHDTLKNSLESQYIEDDKVREIISGSVCEFEKIPVNKGAHNYDPALVKVYTDACGKTAEVIETIEVVDSKKFEKLCPDFIPEVVLDKCRINKWTFKSDFRRKEAATQGEKVSEAAVDDAISKVLTEVNSIKVPKKAAKTTKKVV